MYSHFCYDLWLWLQFYVDFGFDECKTGCYVSYLQPVKMMEDFLRLARENTSKNLETCGVLAGSLVS